MTHGVSQLGDVIAVKRTLLEARRPCCQVSKYAPDRWLYARSRSEEDGPVHGSSTRARSFGCTRINQWKRLSAWTPFPYHSTLAIYPRAGYDIVVL